MARPRSFDDDEVLRIARDQFWSTGYAATSVDDILTATGLGKGSLYGAFGNKVLSISIPWLGLRRMPSRAWR